MSLARHDGGEIVENFILQTGEIFCISQKCFGASRLGNTATRLRPPHVTPPPLFPKGKGCQDPGPGARPPGPIPLLYLKTCTRGACCFSQGGFGYQLVEPISTHTALWPRKGD